MLRLPPPRFPAWLDARGRLALGYVLLAVFLDWVSFIRPLLDLNITPWNPQPALAMGLLLLSRRWAWLVWGTLFASDVVVRGWPEDPQLLLTASLALGASYLVAAEALRHWLPAGLRLTGRRDAAVLIAVLALGALLNSAVYVGILAWGGLVPEQPLNEALARYWVGDVVGLLVVLPLLLQAWDAERRALLLAVLRHPTGWATGLGVAVLLGGIGLGTHVSGLDYSFLLLLPVTWAAVRFGAAGALLAAGLTQLGLIVSVQVLQRQDWVVFELQVLMAAIAITGLLLGVIVDERERAEQELRQTLRLAAAGQMSAALAHELSQPLTALSTYAKACDLLVQAAPTEPEAQRAQLAKVAQLTHRMGQDARRAGEVVRRLRDFFRTGATALARTELTPLVNEAVALQDQRAQALGVRWDVQGLAGAPPLWIDAVQIALVLRNLLANALDACAEQNGPRQVALQVQVQARQVVLVVTDSGPGVDAARAATLFELGVSDKPEGMGVGLSISRAIVEAHGGRLWVEPGPHGHFAFSLLRNLELELEERHES